MIKCPHERVEKYTAQHSAVPTNPNYAFALMRANLVGITQWSNPSSAKSLYF